MNIVYIQSSNCKYHNIIYFTHSKTSEFSSLFLELNLGNIHEPEQTKSSINIVGDT